jgi:biotin carboxyl carrier protein
MKYTVSINNNEYIVAKENNQITLNGEAFSVDCLKVNDGNYHIIKNGKTYDVDVLRLNHEEKILVLKVNGNKYELKVADQYDALLKQLGMDNLSAKKLNHIKAPMPGLVLSILVEEGKEVKKGDALIILEAMKMENILKSPADGIVKKIAVKKGVPVEKNQLLIEF